MYSRLIQKEKKYLVDVALVSQKVKSKVDLAITGAVLFYPRQYAKVYLGSTCTILLQKKVERKVDLGLASVLNVKTKAELILTVYYFFNHGIF